MLGIPDVALCQIKFLLQTEKSDVISNVHELMSQDIKAKMTGAISYQLFDKNKKSNFLKRAEDTLRFF